MEETTAPAKAEQATKEVKAQPAAKTERPVRPQQDKRPYGRPNNMARQNPPRQPNGAKLWTRANLTN